MIPLNNAERKSSFFLFLLFFIISVALIVTAVFYGIQVPFKENALMKHQIEDFQKDQVFRQDFSAKMAETKGLLDKIDKQGVDYINVNSIVAANLDTLDRKLGVDSSAHTLIYRTMISSMRDVQRLKDALRAKQGNEKDQSSLQTELDKARADLTQCQGQVYQMTHSGK